MTTRIPLQVMMVCLASHGISWTLTISPRANCRRDDYAGGASRSRDTWKVFPYW